MYVHMGICVHKCPRYACAIQTFVPRVNNVTTISVMNVSLVRQTKMHSCIV